MRGEVEKRSVRGDAKKIAPEGAIDEWANNSRHARQLAAAPVSRHSAWLLLAMYFIALPSPPANSSAIKAADMPRAARYALLSLRKRYDEIAPLFSSRTILHARALIPLMSGINVPRVTSLLDCYAMMNLLVYVVLS